MKLYKYLLAFFLIIISNKGFSQVTPPSPYPANTKVNYIRVWEPQIPISDPAQVVNKTVAEVKQTTEYFDGLGRPIQTVAKGQSPLQKDVVTAKVYDEFGREQYQYLPFVSTGMDGKFKQDPFQQQQIFSQTQYPGETFYYGKTNYEPSPLNRVSKTMPAGNSWSGAGRGDSVSYQISGVNEVRIWNIDNGGSLVLPSSPKFYDGGQLYRTVMFDAHGKRTVEYKDKGGKIVLKKVEILANAVINSHTGWLCTYFIFDDFDNLRFVISPKAVEQISANWTLAAAIANELCFQYAYDGRNRMIIKKVPGSAEVNMVYDARDRLVMTQDGNLRQANKWMVTLYDGLNRPIITGLFTNTSTHAQHQTAATASSTYPFAPTPQPAQNWELLTETHYDDYTGVPAGLSSNLINTYVNGTNFITTYNTAPFYAQQLVVSNQTINKITWTKTKVLGTASTFLGTVNLYDEKGRIIQTQSNNLTGGIDVITTQYDWSGKVLRSHHYQKKVGTNAKEYQTLSKYSYDHAGRLLDIKKTFTAQGVATIEKTIVQNSYDELGQLKTKKLGQQISSPTNPIETLTYDYNIRSWLLGVNRDYIKDIGNNYFGFELGYDKLATIINGSNYVTPQYTGNISGTIWKSKGDLEKRKYDFSYDAANRILKADFNQYTGGTFNKTANVDFSSVMGDGTNPATAYDANGNILAMKQWGLQLNTSPVIDQLTYSYHTTSNKLKAVNDAIVTDNKLRDFTNKNTTADDYGYDKNGNMITDLNKRLNGSVGLDQVAGGAIQYNHLNLPQIITAKKDDNTLKGTITYTYDATGNKLRKIVTDNTVNTARIDTTLYISGFEYKDDTLQQVAHEEGRIRSSVVGGLSSFHYDYFIKDHLGNTRMVLTEEQQTNQYPAATMELANNTTESAFYSKIPETRVTKPAGYTGDVNTLSYVSKTNGSGNKIGPGITLKVMAGDKFDIKVNSWYKTNGVAPGAAVNPLADLLSALTNGVGNLPGSKSTPTQLQQAAVFTPGATVFLNSQPAPGTKPKAYLNWVLFDEQFKLVQASSGAELVGADNVFTNHLKQNLAVNKNGYLYIYVSNATPNIDVFFDNLQITHNRGALLEESHYYPFGLLMSGISSRAANKIEANKRFQGQEFAHREFSDGSGLEMYEFKYRMDDPQTGRFWQVDPLADKYVYNSTYAFSENKVTTHVELEGLEAEYIFGKTKQEVANAVQGLANWLDNAVSFFTKTNTSTEVSSTPTSTTSTGTTVTTNTQTNWGGNINYIISHNSNEGNPEPYFKTTTTVSADTKTETKLSKVTSISKTSVDSKQVVTNEAGAKTSVNIRGIPLTVTGSGSISTSGETKMTAQGSVGTSNTQGVANVQYGSKGQQQNVSVGVGAQQKAGKTTTTTIFGIKFSW